MLSIVDLIDAGTVRLDLAAYLMARISKGASFMTGARPGGAGKTAVMCALLNLCPADVELVAADAPPPRLQPGKRICCICHEIGAGPYFAYLWGRELRAYSGLSEQGYLLATNLHADDVDEARAQVCIENGVPEKHFNAFDLLLFLRVEGHGFHATRTVSKVYASGRTTPHRLIYEDGVFHARPDTAPQYVSQCRNFLEELARSPIRTIEGVREHVLRFLTSAAP